MVGRGEGTMMIERGSVFKDLPLAASVSRLLFASQKDLNDVVKLDMMRYPMVKASTPRNSKVGM